MKSVGIIGGGITGLTVAFRLRQAGVPVTVYEAGRRAGGVIQSVRLNGFLAECGPNSILETSPKISSLVEDAGLAGRRMYSDPGAEKRYLVRNGRLVELPGSLPRFLRTPLFSTRAKLRLFAEPFIPRPPAGVEESVEQLVVRRLGREFLDYAINPLVRGVYAGDPARLSVRHAFPKLHALEQRYRSLMLGQVLGARERRRSAEVSKQNAKKLSFDEGLQVLTDTLARRLGDAVQFGTPVKRLERAPDGWRLFVQSGGEEKSQEHSAVVFAGTAGALSRMQFAGPQAPNFSTFSEINYPPVASVVLGFRRAEVAHPLDGFGVLIPEVEKCNILGTLFSSSLFPNRAPAGHVVLTSYLGGARSPEVALQDPEKLVHLALQDLQKLLGVTGKPVFAHHFIFPRAIPQYNVGYGKFKELMDAAETNCPGFFLAGHFRDGISLGDSIVSGHNVVDRIQAHLATLPDRRSADRTSLQTVA